MNTVKLKDFFNFGLQEPINRLAYTNEDIEYKIKIIKKMQELGMKISTDKVGNICGTIVLGDKPKATIAIGSHTDSVYNGGQYDGPVGVLVGLKSVEELIKNKNCNGIVKVVIYSCEESSRFGNACLGSKYLNGTITEEDFDKITVQKKSEDGKTITLREAISESKKLLHQNVDNVEEVDKIFDKVDYALETHIEQYKILNKQYKKDKNKDLLGIVTSIGSAVRVQYDVTGKSDHTGSTPMKKRVNAVDTTALVGKEIRKLGKKYEKEGKGRASQVEISTPGHNRSFNQIPNNAQGLIDFRLLGDNTPDNVLADFNNILQKVEKKTKTQTTITQISSGSPVNTSTYLNCLIEDVCSQNNVQYMEMPSYAGQDTGYVPATEKTMLFIPSTGGSHNPEENTKKKFIKVATNVTTKVCTEILAEKLIDRISVDPSTISNSSVNIAKQNILSPNEVIKDGEVK